MFDIILKKYLLLIIIIIITNYYYYYYYKFFLTGSNKKIAFRDSNVYSYIINFSTFNFIVILDYELWNFLYFVFSYNLSLIFF